VLSVQEILSASQKGNGNVDLVLDIDGQKIHYYLRREEKPNGDINKKNNKHSKEETIPYSKEALLFLQTKPTERAELSMVTKLLASTDEEKRKDREKVKAFILALVEIMRTHNYQQIHILETIEIASFAGDPSSSGKTLVEYLGLLLPQLKV
jgi:hypothetical protein